MKEKVVTKNKTQLCPNCKIGQETYLLDRYSLFCPYIQYNSGFDCRMFKVLYKSSLHSIKKDTEKT